MTTAIKILGTGCKNCVLLEANAREAVTQLGLSASVEKVTDMAGIMSYGIMRTPALVVNEQVKLYGRVPSVDEIKRLLTE